MKSVGKEIVILPLNAFGLAPHARHCPAHNEMSLHGATGCDANAQADKEKGQLSCPL